MNRIIVFGKAPVPGQAKTRLARAIGERRAAELAARMLDHTVSVANEAAVGPVELCGAPASHPLLVAVAARHGVPLTAQADGDLGQRMLTAFESTLQQAEAAAIIGTDCPAMTATAIRDAVAALSTTDAAFVPATDGGYVLIGLRRPAAALFTDIDWSTASVMDQTRARLRALGWTWWEAEPLPDVDEAEDLARLPQDWWPQSV